MGKLDQPRFIESDPGSLEQVSARSVAEPGRFRERLRRNAAEVAGLVAAATVEASGADVVLERLLGEDDLLPFYVLEVGADLGRSVCKIAFDDERDGTGFLIGPDLLLTNNHVIGSPERALEARCVFDFQLNADRKPRKTVTFRLEPASLFLTSDSETGLDYTFVRIDKTASEAFGQIAMRRGSFTSLNGEYANVVQHADGKMKRVALRNNRILIDSGVTIRYTADTMGGSSGSPVFNSDWLLIGLHHASVSIPDDLRRDRPELKAHSTLNEAVKISAIASDLEQRLSRPEGVHAREVLRCFAGTDSVVGYFGVLGRATGEGTALEKVVRGYVGEAGDVDIGFWNVEWFTNRFVEKAPAVGKIVANLQLDIYVLTESSPAAAEYLVGFLAEKYGLDFGWAAAEPLAQPGKQSATVLWNRQTVERLEADWPEKVRPWLSVDSRDFDELDLETVHGKVFNRYPALFRFKALQREEIGDPFDFNLVPLHLKAMAEGAERRRMAAKIIAAAIAETTKQFGETDWVVGGDFNAELATGDFAALTRTLSVLSAEDEAEGAMTYLKSPRSLIDHIFISPNLARQYGAKDFFIVATDDSTPDYVRQVSDHRPVLVRLSLRPSNAPVSTTGAPALPDGLGEMLARLSPATVS